MGQEGTNPQICLLIILWMSLDVTRWLVWGPLGLDLMHGEDAKTPGHPHNFTPLRPVTTGLSAMDRVPWRCWSKGVNWRHEMKEPVCSLFWDFFPPKQGHFKSKQGSFWVPDRVWRSMPRWLTEDGGGGVRAAPQNKSSRGLGGSWAYPLPFIYQSCPV